MKHIPNPKVRPSSHEEAKVISTRIYNNRRKKNGSLAVPNVPAKGEQGGMYKGRYV